MRTSDCLDIGIALGSPMLILAAFTGYLKACILSAGSARQTLNFAPKSERAW